MFGELHGLVGRDFMVGYVLPLTLFVLCLALMLAPLLRPEAPTLVDMIPEGLAETTLLVGLLWLGAVALLALNRQIIRFKEGYGTLNPLRVLRRSELSKFRKLQREIRRIDARRDALLELGLPLNSAQLLRRRMLHRMAAERFPDRESFLLPTAFGNTIRSWERYSYILYGVDAIPAWSRLMLVVPADSRTLADQDKTTVDFWVNLWFLSEILVLVYLASAAIDGAVGAAWPLMAVPVSIVASIQARKAALSWGESVKAIFDVHLQALGSRMGLPGELSAVEQHKRWEQLSQAMIYRNVQALRQSSLSGEKSRLSLTPEELLEWGRRSLKVAE